MVKGVWPRASLSQFEFRANIRRPPEFSLVCHRHTALTSFVTL